MMLEDMRIIVMSLIHYKRAFSKKWINNIAPKVMENTRRTRRVIIIVGFSEMVTIGMR